MLEFIGALIFVAYSLIFVGDKLEYEVLMLFIEMAVEKLVICVARKCVSVVIDVRFAVSILH